MGHRTGIKRALFTEDGDHLEGAIPSALQSVIAVVGELVERGLLDDVDRGRFQRALHHASELLNSEHEPIWTQIGGSDEPVPTVEDEALCQRYAARPGGQEWTP